MEVKNPYFFISYARADSEIVNIIVHALEARGIRTWFDIKDLKPGSQWEIAIQDALSNANGMIVFISKSSYKSAYIIDELSYMMDKGAFILPVILEKGVDIFRLRQFKSLDISKNYTKPIDELKLQKGIDQIVDALQYKMDDLNTHIEDPLQKNKEVVKKEKFQKLASAIAEETRNSDFDPKSSAKIKSLFIVHGRDYDLLDEIENYIASLGIKPIVMTKIAGAEKSLFQKFLTWGTESRFAIVLISADDFGASRQQYELPDVGDRSLQFRARQNVILELGFFYGHLGWENVFVMQKKPDKLFPNFEPPSDLSGVLFDTIDKEGKWKDIIKDRLIKAGFDIS